MKFGDNVRVTGGFFINQVGVLVDAKFHAGDGSYSYVVFFKSPKFPDGFERLIIGSNLEKLD